MQGNCLSLFVVSEAQEDKTVEYCVYICSRVDPLARLGMGMGIQVPAGISWFEAPPRLFYQVSYSIGTSLHTILRM